MESGPLEWNPPRFWNLNGLCFFGGKNHLRTVTPSNPKNSGATEHSHVRACDRTQPGNFKNSGMLRCRGKWAENIHRFRYDVLPSIWCGDLSSYDQPSSKVLPPEVQGPYTGAFVWFILTSGVVLIGSLKIHSQRSRVLLKKWKFSFPTR